MTDGLLLDASLVRGQGELDRIATEHVERRQGDAGGRIAALVVPDNALTALDRAVGKLGVGPLDVAVVCDQGAGGLLPLADREFTDLTITSAQVELRDLGDLAGNAARVGAAARTLPESIEVRVGLPLAPGWQEAAETIDVEGLQAAVAADAELMGGLVELDVPFVVSSGIDGPDQVDRLLAAVQVLVDDADVVRARSVLTGEESADDLAIDLPRVRRRLQGVWFSGF